MTSPQIGWQAHLSELFHSVSGTVTILDEDSIQVDDFTYDGGGPKVYFYLGTADSPSAFATGIPIGPQLTLGTSYDGTQDPLVYDLPMGNTLEGWHAISVWCVDFSANFGSGTFAPISALSADFDKDGDVDGQDFLVWQRSAGSGTELSAWQEQYGNVASNLHKVPEPSSVIFSAIMVITLAAGRLKLL